MSLLSERDALLALYARLGFATVPLIPNGKRPLRRGWQTPSADAWQGAPPDANVGILCGSASGGLVVLDFDTPDGPHEVFGMQPRELAVHTIVVCTARGWHVYARHSPAVTTSSRAGLDVRGEGSQVVAPPSIHPSGAAYSFAAEPLRVAALCELALPQDVLGRVKSVEPNGFAATGGGPMNEGPDWARAEEWVALQSPKLRAAWAALRAGKPSDDFDRSSADFAIARCLWEGGWDERAIVAVLLALPGSKPAERGAQYASRTAARAQTAGRT